MSNKEIIKSNKLLLAPNNIVLPIKFLSRSYRLKSLFREKNLFENPHFSETQKYSVASKYKHKEIQDKSRKSIADIELVSKCPTVYSVKSLLDIFGIVFE